MKKANNINNSYKTKIFALLTMIFLGLSYITPSFATTNLSTVSQSSNIPKWTILWIILPQLNVTHGDMVYKSILTEEEIAKVYEMGERTEKFIEEAANNAVNIEISYITSNLAVSSLTEDEYIYVNEDDLPYDVKDRIEQLKPHIKVVTYKLDDDNPKINAYWGLAGGLFARVRMLDLYYFEKSETRPCPEDVYLHELLHCFDWFYETVLGYPMPGTHNPELYGYEKINNTYAEYYGDTFAGKVKTTNGEYIGIQKEMWSHNPSNEDIYKRRHDEDSSGCNSGLSTRISIIMLFFLILKIKRLSLSYAISKKNIFHRATV